MRANLLDELNKPYVVTARAKGLREWRLVLRYPVRLALNPLVSTIGWYLPQLFSGSLIVATVMNLPNIGPLLLRALINQDMYLAGGILLIYSFLTIVGTLLSDIAAGADRSAHPDGDDEGRCPTCQPPARRPRTGSPSPPTGSWCGGASAGITWRMASAGVLICLYVVVLCPDFFSTQDPERTDARQAFIPVQTLHLFDDGWNPWVPGDRRQAQSGDAAHGMDDRSADARSASASSPAASPTACSACSRPTSTCSARADPGAAHLPAGLRPARPRSVVAHHARHADLDDGRPGRRHAQRHPRRRAGRHLRLLRRHRPTR